MAADGGVEVTVGVRVADGVTVEAAVGAGVGVGAGGNMAGRAVTKAAASNSAPMKPRRPRFTRKNWDADRS